MLFPWLLITAGACLVGEVTASKEAAVRRSCGHGTAQLRSRVEGCSSLIDCLVACSSEGAENCGRVHYQDGVCQLFSLNNVSVCNNDSDQSMRSHYYKMLYTGI